MVSDRPQRAPALESRGTVAAAKPRAHGNFPFTHILLEFIHLFQFINLILGSSSIGNRPHGIIDDTCHFLYTMSLLHRGEKLLLCWKNKLLIITIIILSTVIVRLITGRISIGR